MRRTIECEEALALRIAATLRRCGVPGASIALLRGTEIVWARGIGTIEAGSDAQVLTDTLFQAASISKCVTALAVLRLVEQGKVDLDTVGAYPGYAVTLRQLLSHTAGVSVEGFEGYSRGSPLPTIAQILAGEPPANSPPIVIVNSPGTQYRYSGGGYVLVQEIIEAASGEAFANAMAKLVLLPLGMTDSSFEQPLPEALASNAAAGHDVRSRPLEGKWRTYPEAASGGLWTTPSDLLRFALAVQQAYDGVDETVISTATARDMLTPQHRAVVKRDRFAGLGVFMSERAGRFGHTGINRSYRSRFLATKGIGQGIAIMTNSSNGERIFNPVERYVDAEFVLGAR